MNETNFFRDLHGLQNLGEFRNYDRDNFSSIAECEFTRIENVFKYDPDINISAGLIYLKCFYDMVSTRLKSDKSNSLVYSNIIKFLKGCKENRFNISRDFFSNLDSQGFKELEEVARNILERLPANHFEKPKLTSVNVDDNYKIVATLRLEQNEHSHFSVPIKERKEIINRDQALKDFSLLYVEPAGEAAAAAATQQPEAYPLKTMFDIYKDLIPNYSFEQFQYVIQDQLFSSKTNDEIVTYLLDSFGCGLFDFINEIVQNRHSIDFELDSIKIHPGLQTRNVKKPSAVIAGTVTVQSEKESACLKKLRKIEKKDKNKLPFGEYDQAESDYEAARNAPIFKKQAAQPFNQSDFPHVHDQLRNHMITTKYDGISIMQPENAVKKFTSDYSEFIIPPGSKSDIPKLSSVKVKSLDKIGQLVFKDIKEFNRIQSEVFPAAYHSNENILVCAPTGAGKTNIALLTIVHQIKCHMEGGLIKKNNFKIIYVCPMKALATEMVANFSKKLAPIGMTVKECTGDMQLTKKEIFDTQILVTTPEKWDVITRKGAVDTEVVGLVKLLIIDEVHLLNGSRGPVIEALVARTLRQVISNQSMIRIVALSATLPGYLDVAQFLKVEPKTGLFFFDNRFRSVPLTTAFIGIKKKNEPDVMDLVCYKKLVEFVQEGHQAMVFVTSRNATLTVAKNLIALAQERGTLNLFKPEKLAIGTYRAGTNTGELDNLIQHGFGTHHAGMQRHARLEVEHLFRTSQLKVIVCTSTLAWGVNLPAHAVIIRGTQYYDATSSSFIDMDILDVQQIFGRAGRPQYDTSGHGIIITSMANMSRYMGLMLSQVPIESKFLDCLVDNLNAEIVLGTVSNTNEAMEWLRNTFLYHRIKKNPLVYGLSYTDIWNQMKFIEYLQRCISDAARTLDDGHMIRYSPQTGEMSATNFGRIASFYYISHRTMIIFLEQFQRSITEANLLQLLSEAFEFQQIQVRMDELHELEVLREYNELNINLDFGNVSSKVICLIQAYISRAHITISSLISDCHYIMQTVVRLIRALLEVAKDRNYALQVTQTLALAKMMEQQLWDYHHPLWQFKELARHLNNHRIQDALTLNIEDFKEMSIKELENLFRSKPLAMKIKHFCRIFPMVNVDYVVKPITEGVIRIKLLITPTFTWDNQHLGNVQHYYAYVEDPSHDSIYHIESFVINKRMTLPNADPIEFTFTVPLTKPLSLEYHIQVVNTQFLHSSTTETISLDDLKLITAASFETKILDVQPLPVRILRNPKYEKLYPFTYFNTVQSQVFHSCYYTDTPIILGAPTGSGKTIVAELCMLRLFSINPNQKIVYIAPMKALVRERVNDWTKKFETIQKKVIEVTGDVTPRSELIRSSHIIITTPEKWDAMSRNWTEKDFVKQVGLMIIDEIHLLGEDRGPVLEVIVSRMNCINSKKQTNVRIIGLSTAMANPGDLAYWLNCDKRGIFNFSSAVRPVPLEIHLKGFDVKHYCPRMAAMNRSVFQAICQYASKSSALIFVSSRKQTRITGYELMKFLLSENKSEKWHNFAPGELELVKTKLKDQDLCNLISFGIGMHHAGLTDSDRNIVEELYVGQKIQVLVATATLAWGVNFPARLVVVKGTEYFDAATKRYVDMPITDVIQMAGRAGRPQFDTSGVACVMVQENKKNFYRKFLFEPFPVESNLLETLPDHVNAEIANGNIVSKAQLIEFIESTFFFRRLLANPNYYQLEINDDPLEYVGDLADSVVETLVQHNCVIRQENEENALLRSMSSLHLYESTFLGMLACQYYLSHKTVRYLNDNITENDSIDLLLSLICNVEEYKLFPVRHNEDNINKELARDLNVKTYLPFDSPSLKVRLMIHCYLFNVNLPNQEYVLDLKSVFDQIIRIIHAMINLAANKKWLECTMKLIYLCQMIVQGHFITESNLIMLPYMNKSNIIEVIKKIAALYEIDSNMPEYFNIAWLRSHQLGSEIRKIQLTEIFQSVFGQNQSIKIMEMFLALPILTISTSIATLSNQKSIQIKIDDKKGDEIDINASEEGDYILKFTIENQSKRNGKSKQTSAYCKRFNKQKDEFWCLILKTENDLILRKFALGKSSRIIDVPLYLRQGRYCFHLHIMSDCYIGLDQEIKLMMNIGR